jgi:DNA modification methylase
VKHREFLEGCDKTESEFITFLSRYLALTKANALPGSLHYVCMDALHSFEVLTAARHVDLTLKTTCTWAKTNAGMGSLYRQMTEFVHVFKNGDDRVPHINNVQLGKHGRYRTTLWTYPGANTFRRGRMEDLSLHPTVKNWSMVADAIKDSTRPGDVVLDAFCGSGTTIIAAEKVHRVGYGIELDPLYVDVAIRRWEQLTGKSAVNARTGLTFTETEQRQRLRSAGAATEPSSSAQNPGPVDQEAALRSP